MNSFISVEERDIAADEINDVILSTTELESEENDTRSSISSENVSSDVDNPPEVILCAQVTKPTDDFTEKSSLNGQPVEFDLNKVRKGVYRASSSDSDLVPVQVENFPGSVNLMYLPLDTVLLNCTSECDNEMLVDNIQILNKIFDSDSDEGDFTGFSNLSDNDFDGFELSDSDIDEKDIFLKKNNHIVGKELNSRYLSSTPVGQTRPSNIFQNYSKGALSPICNSTLSNSEKEANDSRKFIKEMPQKNKKERISLESKRNSSLICKNQSQSPQRIIDEIDNFNNNLDYDFIGQYCNSVGCTISWLESRQVKKFPVKVTNGIVLELNEFARKIDWEPKYVAEWILRLRGIKLEQIEDNDLKKINSVIKRRKALSVTFAGFPSSKNKLAAFESEEFFLDSFKYNENKCKDFQLSDNKSNSNQEINNDSKTKSSIFIDNGDEIGPNCLKNGINIQMLNFQRTLSCSITNIIVKELYYFYIKKNVSLSHLVKTLYKLKRLHYDDLNIESTLNNITNLIESNWDKMIKTEKDFANKEFPLESSQLMSIYTKKSYFPKQNCDDQEKIQSNATVEISQNQNTLNPSPTSIQVKKPVPMGKTFDLNSTKGSIGKITRGDIVYLYTKWLKKKMEGKDDIFVSDLLGSVEDLIKERELEFIRIPVGTLMSSSVKLFEEFRTLSKVDMNEATTYLLEDWMDDVKSILNLKIKKGESDFEFNLSAKNSCSESSLNKKENSLSLDSNTGSDEKSNIDSTKFQKEKTHHNEPLEEFEVEKIVGYRIVKIKETNVTEYRVRWVGFTSKDDEWIDEANLNCPELLSQFWEALNRQRQLKNQTVNQESDLNIKIEKDKITKAIEGTQRNTLPYFGIDNISSQAFFNLMIQNLDTSLIDYQHDDNDSSGQFHRRCKVTKRDVLNIYDGWRKENQQLLLTGGNQRLNVNVLIAQVKNLMGIKRVRHFNSGSIMDACFRMSLMKEKLKDPQKVKDYLSGDFIELMQCSQKHQENVQEDRVSKLKDFKLERQATTSNIKFSEKLGELQNLEKESLHIAKYLKENELNYHLESSLKHHINYLKSVIDAPIEGVPKEEDSLPFSIIVKLKKYGVKPDVLTDLLNISSNKK